MKDFKAIYKGKLISIEKAVSFLKSDTDVRVV